MGLGNKMFKNIREYFWLKKVLKKKEFALFSVKCDIEFFNKCKKRDLEMTNEQENNLRVLLKKEINKEEKDADQVKIVDLTLMIEQVKKVKKLYEQSLIVEKELINYIELLKKKL